MKKSLNNAVSKAVEGNTWKKFTDVSVNRGKTVFPKTAAEQERIGVRWDYDGEITLADGKVYNKFQMQPNAGKIPSSIKLWREEHGGTHAVMADVVVPKQGTQEEVKRALEEASRKA